MILMLTLKVTNILANTTMTRCVHPTATAHRGYTCVPRHAFARQDPGMHAIRWDRVDPHHDCHYAVLQASRHSSCSGLLQSQPDCRHLSALTCVREALQIRLNVTKHPAPTGTCVPQREMHLLGTA